MPLAQVRTTRQLDGTHVSTGDRFKQPGQKLLSHDPEEVHVGRRLHRYAECPVSAPVERPVGLGRRPRRISDMYQALSSLRFLSCSFGLLWELRVVSGYRPNTGMNVDC